MSDDFFHISTERICYVDVNDVPIPHIPGLGPFFDGPCHRLGGALSPVWQFRHILIFRWGLLRFDSADSAAQFAVRRDPSLINGVIVLRDIVEVRTCPAPVAPEANPYCIAFRSGTDSWEFLSLGSSQHQLTIACALTAARPILVLDADTPTTGRGWYRRRRDMPWSAPPAAALALLQTQSEAMAVREWEELVAGAGTGAGAARRGTVVVRDLEPQMMVSVENEVENNENVAPVPPPVSVPAPAPEVIIAPPAAASSIVTGGIDLFTTKIQNTIRAEDRIEIACNYFAANIDLGRNQLTMAIEALPFKNERMEAVRAYASAIRAAGLARPRREMFEELRWPDERESAMDAVRMAFV